MLDMPGVAAKRIILGQSKPTDAAQVAGVYLILCGKPDNGGEESDEPN